VKFVRYFTSNWFLKSNNNFLPNVRKFWWFCNGRFSECRRLDLQLQNLTLSLLWLGRLSWWYGCSHICHGIVFNWPCFSTFSLTFHCTVSKFIVEWLAYLLSQLPFWPLKFSSCLIPVSEYFRQLSDCQFTKKLLPKSLLCLQQACLISGGVCFESDSEDQLCY
jgi:hypothetical protein